MNADLRGLAAKLPSLATLDAVDDDALSGRRPCPLDKFTIADVRLLHKILSVAQGQGWLPIESAPTTGLLLTFHPRFGQRIMRPDPHNIGWYLDETGGPTREVTHWQPLPAAPTQPDGVSK